MIGVIVIVNTAEIVSFFVEKDFFGAIIGKERRAQKIFSEGAQCNDQNL